MGSPWTDESAILRDLSFAQGRWVPGSIDSAVAGCKPPSLNITEETEEEYYRRWATDCDFSAGPDLSRIKQMLELMQDEEASDDDMTPGPIEIRKMKPMAKSVKPVPQLNPKAIAFVPKTKGNKTKEDKTKENKTKDDTKENKTREDKTKENKDPAPNARRTRNVAIDSIIARNCLTAEVYEPIKLRKPEDFIKPKSDDYEEGRQIDSIDKVRNWLQSQDIMLCSMFKKKLSVGAGSSGERSNLVDRGVSMFKQSPVKVPVASDKCSDERSPHNEAYTPSSWADEYYKKAVSRSRVRDLLRDDVWGRAEKIMKKIDEDKAEQLRLQQAAAGRDVAGADCTDGHEVHLTVSQLENSESPGDDGITAELLKIQESTLSPHITNLFHSVLKSGAAHILLREPRHGPAPAAACCVCAVLTHHQHHTTAEVDHDGASAISSPVLI